MNKPKRQHWVPCFYLRHFATPDTKETDNPLVWVFSKDSGDPFLTSIKIVAAQTYLDSPRNHAGQLDWTVEKRLAPPIEYGGDGVAGTTGDAPFGLARCSRILV